MHPRLDNFARQFRSAVLGGDYAHAQQLLTQYAEALGAVWTSLPEAERAGSPIPDQSRELLGWARDVATVQRALTIEHLAVLDKASRYQPSGWLQSRSRAIEVEI